MSFLLRTLLASAFIGHGIDAATTPEQHSESAANLMAQLNVNLDEAESRTLVKTYGGLTTLAGGALAIGFLPRLAALALVVLMAPSLATSCPLVNRERSEDERRAKRGRFFKDLGLVGALLAVAFGSKRRK